MPGRAGDLHIDLVEFDEVPASGRGLRRLDPQVGRDKEELAETAQRGLLVEDGACHQLVSTPVVVHVECLRPPAAGIGHRADQRREQFDEATGAQELARRVQRFLLHEHRGRQARLTQVLAERRGSAATARPGASLVRGVHFSSGCQWSNLCATLYRSRSNWAEVIARWALGMAVALTGIAPTADQHSRPRSSRRPRDRPALSGCRQ
jgi:hypothetical protein